LNNFRVGYSYPSNTNQIRKPIDRQLSYDYDQSLASSFPRANIPTAPIFNADLIANKTDSFNNRSSMFDFQTPHEQTMVND
jgi:hypothetical protein